MDTPKARKRFPLVTTLIDNFGFSPGLALVVSLFITGLCVLAVIWVVKSAPPRKLYITSGPEGSSFQRWAGAYKDALAKHGVTLEVLPSSGSLNNLDRMLTKGPNGEIVDIGFISGGIAKEQKLDGLMSLGSVGYQPLWVFYRGNTTISRLSQLEGQRIAIGSTGSATRAIVQTLLQANGISGAPTVFSDLDSSSAAEALLQGQLDAVFLMGDSASTQTLRSLGRAPGIQLFTFTQADAYVRRNTFLNKISLPQGSLDLGKNLPAQDVVLVGPVVELVAREGLHSALSDLLLDVAKQVHGNASLLQKRGDFPVLVEHDFPLSDDAVRYYKSGKGILYRVVSSFWVASLLNRLLVAVVPLMLVVIPAIRLMPVAYRFRIQLKLYRCYRPLLRVERETYEPLTPERVQELLTQLEEIEVAVNRLKVPASFADRFYWLRRHLLFVRERVKNPGSTPDTASVGEG
ncbi:TAXI family TRAP transporter solute-binding subunit [Rariglobus hedericola]|uniref:C4-dicarboxylate ABC transporter substrate-binding protein n=1 Tax=Rariglobus hedericola TaxID=2597822 RepID=A0A556QJI2_9BACT|nr:TAXI family TRAP transporter solute-binding subunit [Rariglobus hedericola]TSJ76782.1 C4-dicarboxylate ABC transporter substrate-binding protein [Rariglobus hedericola]